MSDPERVLALAPTGADAALTGSILADASLACAVARDLPALIAELDDETGVLLLTDEAMAHPAAADLVTALRRQPVWSDLPIVLLSSEGADSPAGRRAMEALDNVTVLDRPVRASTLVSSLRTAIRARRRQYELREQMAALERSESTLRDFFESATVGLHWTDGSGVILRANQAELDLLGYRREEYIGHAVAEFHEDPATARQLLRRLAAGDAVQNHPARLVHRDGSIRDVLISSSGGFEDGRLIHSRSFTLDVTDRRRAEEARTLNAAIVDSSDDAIMSKALDGTILSWNAGATRLLGYSESEAVGRPVNLVVPADRREEEVAILKQLARGERLDHFETVRVARDGRRIAVSLSVSPRRDASGQVVGVASVARDVTARAIAEQKLRKQDERLQLLWGAAAVLLTAEDPTAMMSRVYEMIAPHLGLDMYFNYMVSDTDDSLRLQASAGIGPEELPPIKRLEFGEYICGRAALTRRPIVATGIQNSSDPMVRRVKDFGTRAYVCNPLIADGDLLGTVSFASRTRDGFDPEELEFLETICHYVTVASHRIRLVRRLRDADRRKDEFLATLAHELRNPLAPIRNALHIMRLTGNDRAAVEASRAMMERQLGQMVRLIDDLLDLSRITRGTLELRRERVDLAAVIGGAVETTRPLIEAAGHHLDIALPEQPVDLEADPVRLGQVFSNLLGNAAKYMNHRGTISVSVERRDDDVAVSVRDTGIGIPEEALGTVFKMFTRVHQPRDDTHGGLGIGLTLVKRLVELHGGRVRARSGGAGQGAEFTVTLPLAPERRAVHQESQDAEPAKRRRCRILAADDNRDAAESMATMLRLMGHEVRTVPDGRRAVEVAATFQPDAVLLDIGLRGMNGFEAARRIREQRGDRPVLLVAVTGWGQEEDKRRAAEAGFDHHFTKPINPVELERLLDSSPRTRCAT